MKVELSQEPNTGFTPFKVTMLFETRDEALAVFHVLAHQSGVQVQEIANKAGKSEHFPVPEAIKIGQAMNPVYKAVASGILGKTL